MIIRTLAFILIVAIGAGAGLYGTGPLLAWIDGDAEASRSEGESGDRSTLVEVGESEERTVRETASAVGTLRAVRDIELRPLVEGRVTEIGIDSGDRVETGDLIVQLDDRAEQASLKDAEATLAEAESEFARSEDLTARDVSSEATLEEARASLLRAEAAVETARNEIDDKRLLAPFDGALGVFDLDIGERIDPETVVTTLDDLSAVTVVFSLPERYFGRVEIGQEVRIVNTATGDRAFTGSVDAIDPRIGDASRAFEIRAEIDNSDGRLTSGMFVDVTLLLDERQSLTVPETALITEGADTFLFTLDDDRASRRVVSLGERFDGSVEIVDGLEGPGRVVVSGYSRLSDGDTVRVRNETDERGDDEAEGAQPEVSEASKG